MDRIFTYISKRPEHDGFDDPALLQAFKTVQSEQAKQLLEAQIDKMAADFAGPEQRRAPASEQQVRTQQAQSQHMQVKNQINLDPPSQYQLLPLSTATAGFTNPGLLQNQQANEKLLHTPYLSLKSQPTQVQLTAEQKNTSEPSKNGASGSHAGFAEPGLLQAEQLDEKNQYGVKVDALLKIAKSQLNTKEGPNNANPYGIWYGNPNDSWCAQFASWCANSVGCLNTDVKKSSMGIPKNQSTTQFRNDYITMGRFANGYTHKNANEEAYKPKAGDFIFLIYYKPNKDGTGDYDYDTELGKYVPNKYGKGAYTKHGHTGIVVAFDGKKVYSIEGNAGDNSDGVYYAYRDLTDYRIDGYGKNGGTSYGAKPD